MNFWEYRARMKELALTEPRNTFKDYQKFWAFMGLIAAVLGMAGVSVLISAVNKDGTTTDPTVLQAKLAIMNMAMGGLIGALGAASQAFFRVSQTDQDTASAMKDMAASLPAAPVLPTGGTTTTTTTVEPSVPAEPRSSPQSAAEGAEEAAGAATERAEEIREDAKP